TAEAHARALADLLEDTRPDSEPHARALLTLGLIKARAEQYDQAIAVLEEALEMMAFLELGPEQINALAQVGVVLENAVEYDRALERFRSAASLSKTMDKKRLLARQHTSIGRVYDLRLNQYAKARVSYAKAFEIYRELEDPEGMALALLDMGRCHRLMGNFNKATAHFQRTLNLIGEDPAFERISAKTRMEQANNAWFQARYQEAFDLQQGVFELSRERQWQLEQVMALNTGGLIWWTLGDRERALRELKDALSLAERLNVRQDEVATTLNNLGLVYRDMGLYEEAIQVLNQALAIDRKINSRWGIAYDLKNLALTHVRMGRPKKALPFFEEALQHATAIGNRINQAKILVGLGESLALLHRPAEASDAFRTALAHAEAMAVRETRWRALYGLSGISLGNGDVSAARDLLNRAVDVIEDMRAEIKVDRLKDGFITDKTAVYESLVGLLADQGDISGAFDVAERSRARNLIDLLGNQRLSLSGAVEQALYDRERSLKAMMAEQRTLAAQAEDPGERQIYQAELQRLRDRYTDLIAEIRRRHPELAGLVSVSAARLSDVQSLLEPGVALAAYYVIPDEILCWVLTRESVELTRSPVGRQTLERSIRDFRRMIQNLEPLERQSKEIYQWVFAPIADKVKGIEILGIVPHGPLHYLSFATLYDGSAFVAEQVPLFYLPSAGILRYTLARRADEKNLRVLAVGNPDLGNQALDLPFSEREVGAIGWNFPDITVMTREKATESWVVRNIEKFGIIHLASHGEFDPVNPLFSAVKLVGDSAADGNLEASEIFGLRITADLVVLSACQTGLGKITGGDDIVGMNRALLYSQVLQDRKQGPEPAQGHAARQEPVSPSGVLGRVCFDGRLPIMRISIFRVVMRCINVIREITGGNDS
ncbi:MAG: tetratricopeptide repeat protein, partial [Deltaproteobacteria bacterium]|nr:tetratricopeptide repeat protein [Deltaproteobacteria bacterium]